MANHLPTSPAPSSGLVPTTDADGRLNLWGALGAGVVLPLCANGSLLVSNGIAYDCLLPGANGHVLRIVGGVPDWSEITGLPVGTDGDIVYHDGAGWVVLAAGNSGDILQLDNSVPPLPSWVDDVDILDLFQGVAAIADDTETIAVPLPELLPDANYSVVASVSNVTDASPAAYSVVISTKTAGSFTATLSGPTISSNYQLEWVVYRST